MAASSPSTPKSFPAKVFAFFCSFGLATVVLSLLLIITLLGTLEQVEHGLFESQKKYFESMIVTNIDLGSWKMPILLPGGFLLMIVLFLNMCCGAVIRIRKNPRTVGVIIAHLSILFLLLAGFVEYFMKKEGNLALFEGQTSDEFQSYHASVIEIEKLEPTSKDGKRSALVIPGKEYQDLSEGRARTFSSGELPFDLVVMNYEINSEPKRAESKERKTQVDGYYLQPLAKKPESELNLDGAYVHVIDKKTKETQKGILWRAAAAPYSFKIGDEVYGVSLTRQSWKLPFAVRLDKFEREVHPGTERARKFTSQITKLERGREEKKIITMNKPLRHEGSVLFQASFSQEQGGSGGPMTRSVFAVVENPSDQWPLYATIAVSIGLLIHMIGQLGRFLSRTKSAPAAKPSTMSVV
jgi:hypothetical protein